MVFIYVLQLEQNKYYVGKTKNPFLRLETHFESYGSAWTKKYHPITIYAIIPDCDDYDEDKYTLQYMEKYGIDNVRGGSFCEIKLSDENKKTIHKMIQSKNNICYGCGNPGHFIHNCKNKNTSTSILTDTTTSTNKMCDCVTSYFSPHRKSKCLLNNIISNFTHVAENEKKDIVCYRCERKGHYASSCYAKKHLQGHSL